MANSNLKILGIIPARYASTRFPGKPLVDIGGKSMLERVYGQAQKSNFLDKIVIATDDERIYNHAKNFGANVLMTASSHISGTDRCREVVDLLEEKFDFVINIQGDEPFIQPEQIDILAKNITSNICIATLYKKIMETETLVNINIPKVIFDTNNTAIYFSRHAIPFVRGVPKADWVLHHNYFKHIGIYAYRVDILKEITKLLPSKLEVSESLEQLRWLENGYKITLFETKFDTFGIDVPKDLIKFRIFLQSIQ